MTTDNAADLILVLILVAVFGFVPVQRVLAKYVRGTIGEELDIPAARKPSRLSTVICADRDAVTAFVSSVRVPTDRVVISHGRNRIMLDKRGSLLFSGMLMTKDRVLRRAAGKLGSNRLDKAIAIYTFSSVTDADDDVVDFVRQVGAADGQPSASIGGETILLTEFGIRMVSALLLASHKKVKRAAIRIGKELPVGWAGWVPSRRVEYRTWDDYLDQDLNAWTFGRKPTLGGKDVKYRRPNG